MSASAGRSPQVSLNCDEGRHSRCLGTVYVPQFDGSKHIVPCQCIVSNCGHGPDAKADA
jgi:hypothetical protein